MQGHTEGRARKKTNCELQQLIITEGAQARVVWEEEDPPGGVQATHAERRDKEATECQSGALESDSKQNKQWVEHQLVCSQQTLMCTLMHRDDGNATQHVQSQDDRMGVEW